MNGAWFEIGRSLDYCFDWAESRRAQRPAGELAAIQRRLARMWVRFIVGRLR